MAEQRKQGRPRGYTEEQVVKAIEIIEGNCANPTGETVKTIMCEKFGISDGINVQTLGEVVKELVRERQEQRMNALVEKLPANVRRAALDFGKQAEARMLHTLAPQFSALEKEAAQDIEARELDNQALRTQVRELRVRLGEEEQNIAELERGRSDFAERIEALQAENAALKSQLAQRDRDDVFREQMIATMREVRRKFCRSKGRVGRWPGARPAALSQERRLRDLRHSRSLEAS